MKLDFGNGAFIEGSNTAAPLFSIVDVGSSKGAADTKLKGLDPTRPKYPFVASLTHVLSEFLRVFAHFPQIVKAYFGG